MRGESPLLQGGGLPAPIAPASGRALRGSVSLPRRRRPRRTAVTAASSSLFTSVFSSLITRFIAFARGKPGDGGAGEDPPRKPPPRSAPLRSAPPGRGGGGTAQPGLPPHRLVFSRISDGEGRSRSPEAAGTRRRAGPAGRGSPRGGAGGALPGSPPSWGGFIVLRQRDLHQRRKKTDRIDGFSAKQRR